MYRILAIPAFALAFTAPVDAARQQNSLILCAAISSLSASFADALRVDEGLAGLRNSEEVFTKAAQKLAAMERNGGLPFLDILDAKRELLATIKTDPRDGAQELLRQYSIKCAPLIETAIRIRDLPD